MMDRERMLAAIRGEVVDRIPWVPRMEFWYRARCRQAKLPAGLRSLSLLEITDRLGAGHYAVIPDFTDCPGELDMIDRGLGLFRLPVLPYQAHLEGVERKVTRRENETIVEYHTPVGSLRTSTIFTEEMLDAGASVPWTSEHAIREPRHFEVLRYIFSRIRVEPQSEGHLALRRQVGDRGLVIGYVSGTACPMQHIMKELIPLDQFFYALHDYPRRFRGWRRQCSPSAGRYRSVRRTRRRRLSSWEVTTTTRLLSRVSSAGTFCRHCASTRPPSMRRTSSWLHTRTARTGG